MNNPRSNLGCHCLFIIIIIVVVVVVLFYLLYSDVTWDLLDTCIHVFPQPFLY